MNGPWLVFLHGVSASREDKWLAPLNAALTWHGREPFPEERVIRPDYRDALAGGVTATRQVPDTWKRPSGEVRGRAISAYSTHMASLEARLRPLVVEMPPDTVLPHVETIPPIPVVVDDAKRYARDKDVRNAVQEIVLRSLEELPPGAQVVILAHSLGTVVAADMLKKLPQGLHLAGLVTIGSPLAAVAELRNGHDLKDFPYDRLGAWVNIYEPRDIVTGGKGIGKFYPKACDLPVTLADWVSNLVHQHHAHFYCAHRAVAAAISDCLHGTAVDPIAAVPAVGVRGLEIPFLQSLYLRELAKRLPARDTDRVRRFELARQHIAVGNSSASALLHREDESTGMLPPEAFLIRPDEPIRGAWDDMTLLALAITLASSPAASPYRVEVEPDTDERRSALVATLSLVRARPSSTTDVDMTEAIFAARKEVTDFLAPGKSLVPRALMAAGLVTLAATGVGLAAAVPAGLAGAAVITSTLAAFGPGGMVGGMATMAALAAASSAAVATGATLNKVAGGATPGADLMGTAIGQAIASNDPETLRTLLMSLLTLVAAQERLSFPTQRDALVFAAANERAKHAHRVAAHDDIDPKSDAAKAARAMLAMLDKALEWLRGEVKATSQDATELGEFTRAYAEAVEGRPDLLQAVLERPARERHAVASIGSFGASAVGS